MTDQNIHPELVSEALAIVDVRDKVLATELLAAAQLTAEQVTSIEIVDDLSFAQGGESLKALKGVQKRLESIRTSMKSPVLDAGRKIDAFFKAPGATLEQAEKTLKTKIGAYQAEQDRKRREAEEAARIERERIERERQEAARREAEERAKLSAEEQTAKAQDAIVAPPAHALPAPVVKAPAPAAKVSGISTRMVAKARVTSLGEVARAALAGNEQARALLTIDQGALAKLVREHGMSLAIPGIEVFEEQVVSARSA